MSDSNHGKPRGRAGAYAQIREVVSALDDQEKQLLQRVLRWERDNLHYKRPPTVKEDLNQIVAEVIPDPRENA